MAIKGIAGFYKDKRHVITTQTDRTLPDLLLLLTHAFHPIYAESAIPGYLLDHSHAAMHWFSRQAQLSLAQGRAHGKQCAQTSACWTAADPYSSEGTRSPTCLSTMRVSSMWLSWRPP